MLSRAQRAVRDDRIARLYTRRNLSNVGVAEAMGVSSNTVWRVVNGRGLSRPNGWHVTPDRSLFARNARIELLYVKGKLTAGQIADRIGDLSEGGVRHVLKTRGVRGRRRPKGGTNRRSTRFFVDREYARRIADRVGTGPGTACRDFAEAAGMKTSTLRRHLTALGVTRRYGSGKARITIADAEEIKRELIRGVATFKEIGARYGVTPSAIGMIAMGKTWVEAPWPKGKTYVPRDNHGNPKKKR